MKEIIICDSTIEGKGVFTEENILKGETICVMTGRRIAISELEKAYESKKVRLDDPIQIEDDMYMLLDKPYIHFNHSCSPNTYVKDVATVVASRNIKKGEEIAFDYSLTEWSNDDLWGINWQEEWNFPCKCRSNNCRKIVREFPTLLKKTKQRLYEKQMLPDFLLRKISKLGLG